MIGRGFRMDCSRSNVTPRRQQLHFGGGDVFAVLLLLLPQPLGFLDASPTSRDSWDILPRFAINSRRPRPAVECLPCPGKVVAMPLQSEAVRWPSTTPGSFGVPPMLVLVVLAPHPRVGPHAVRCTPRLLAAAKTLDRMTCGIAKKLGMAVGDRASRKHRR